MKIEAHWWNGDRGRARRDVYIRSDGQHWEVEAQIGGADGRSRVQECPSQTVAGIVADAWLGGRPNWRQMKV